MKSIYSLIILVLFSITSIRAQVVWDNFQDIRKCDYGFINGTFIPYFANPGKNAVNGSDVVAQYTRNPAELFDVIIMDAEMADLTDYVSGTKSLSIDVYSPAVGKTLQITLENSSLALPANFPTGRHSVYLATTTVANAWETLTFSFDNQPDPSVNVNSVNRLVLLFDPNSNNSDTYYWDNLNGPELDTDPCSGISTDPNIYNDFECNQNVNFTFSHGSVNFRRVVNPDATGLNTSSHVATYTRNAGEENDVIVGNFGGNITAPVAGSVFSLDVWDAFGSTPIRISLQDDQGVTIEDLDQVTSNSTNVWQRLNFAPSASVGNGNIAQFVILFNPGTFTSDQFYFDNFRYSMGSGLADNTNILSVNTFPNPGNSLVNFKYELTKNSDVRIAITDINGKIIETLLDQNQNAGIHTAEWNSSNVAKGLYFFTISTNGNSSTGKIIVE